MDSNLNRGAYKILENELARKLDEGAKVKLKVEVEYQDKSNRPESFRVTYSINGLVSEKVFLNEPTKGV
jgi:hypothetical protein